MNIKLTYFKQSGKYYTEGEYVSLNEHAFQIYGEVRELLKLRILPGLVENHDNYTVLVESDDIAPALIIEK